MHENLHGKKWLTADLPIAVLWTYREFNRDEVSAPRVPYAPNHTVDEVTAYLGSTRNIDPLELSIIGNKALLTDGNHRLIAASRLGYTTVRVNIIVFLGDGQETFYEHTLDRFKPISGDLEMWLKEVDIA
jgi:hypothetical protein